VTLARIVCWVVQLLTCIQFNVSSCTGIGIGIGIGQYYWVLGSLLGIVLTLESWIIFNNIFLRQNATKSLIADQVVFRIFVFYTCFRTSISQNQFRILCVARFRTFAFSHFAFYTSPMHLTYRHLHKKFYTLTCGWSGPVSCYLAAVQVHLLHLMPVVCRWNRVPFMPIVDANSVNANKY